jgi:uncharacterized protein
MKTLERFTTLKTMISLAWTILALVLITTAGCTSPEIRTQGNASQAKSPAENLVNAALGGDATAVQSFLDQGVAVDSRNENGITALIGASQNGHLDVVQMLLAKGADVNTKINQGYTALMEASATGHLDVVQALLAKSADVNAIYADPDYVQMPNGAKAYPGVTTTASEIASRFPGSVIVHGDTGTALSLARVNGHQDIAELLIKIGAK